MAGSGPGSVGVRVVAVGALDLQLGLDIVPLLWAQVLPAHSVCDRETGQQRSGIVVLTPHLDRIEPVTMLSKGWKL